MADTPIVSTITKALSWLKSHLILLGVIVILVVGGIYGLESIIAKHDVAQEAHDQQILTLVTAQTADLKTRMASDEQAATARDLQYAQIITQLSGTIAKQTGQLQQQIKANATLTAQQTAQAIADKIKAQPGEVVAQGDNVTMDLPVSRQVNSSLDTLATTTLQLTEVQKQLQAQTGLTTDAVLELDNAKKVITAQDTQAIIAAKVCTDQISVVKAQARKSKLKFLGIGYLLGLASAHFIGI
jgi:hypothetical protein